MKCILIVEDIAETRDWLKGLLTEAFPDADIGCATSLAEARRCAVGRRVDLALVDISLPDGSGIAFVEEVFDHSPHTYCVMATIHDDDRHLFPALQAGARGYLLKDQPRDRLLGQLQGILKGEPPISPSIARRMLEHFRCARQVSDEIDLSEREEAVLRLIAKGYSRSETGRLLGITANTTAGYLKNIYRKLNISTRAEAALEAARRGLVRNDL